MFLSGNEARYALSGGLFSIVMKTVKHRGRDCGVLEYCRAKILKAGVSMLCFLFVN